jgi:sigma-E factor negative regulatory protein RseB
VKLRAALLCGLAPAIAIAGVAARTAGADGTAAKTETDTTVELLARARQRAATDTYSGVIQVQWFDAKGTRHGAETRVRYDEGVVEVGDGGQVVTSGPDAVVLNGAAWVLPGSQAKATPRADEKYDVTRSEGGDVAGRATIELTARADDGGALVERFFIDKRTGLVLQRDSYDENGAVRRSSTFTHIWSDPSRAGLAPAPSTASATKKGPQVVHDVEAPYRAPSHAGDGFALVARWRHPGSALQLTYSDGLLTASVFEQPGSLDWDRLPAGGEPGDVGGHPAVAYSLPVGDAIVWEHAGIVYTCVGNAPRAELLALALDVSRRATNGSMTRMARVVLAPFGW